MNTDDFEKQLQRQPIRPVPAEWRGEILQTAKARANAQSSTPDSQPTSWWRELFWPCPQAWAGLAAVWIVVLMLNSSGDETAEIAASKPGEPSPEVLIALREQRRLLAELIGSPEPSETPKAFVPQPRSERRCEFVAV